MDTSSRDLSNFSNSLQASAVDEDVRKILLALKVLSEQKNVTENDKNNLKEANTFLKDKLSNGSAEFLAFLSRLSGILAGNYNTIDFSPAVRQQAGLLLKNQIGGQSHKPEVRKAYRDRWLRIPESVRNQVKTNVLKALGREEYGRSAAAQCIQFIAAAELPQKKWPSLLLVLANNIQGINSEPNVNIDKRRESSLEAIGYICQEVSEIDQNYLEDNSNDILAAIMSGVKYENSDYSNNMRIQLAATKALSNSLVFASSNFQKENDRNVIMQVMCETTRSQNDEIKVAALECLVRTMSLYYQHMEPYMAPALFPITLEAMKSDIDEVALQGIEFWSNVCDEETELANEAEEAEEEGRTPDNFSRFYAKGALQYIMPILQETLAKQEDFDDEDDWNPSKAAGMCVSLLASCCKNDVIPYTLPFVETNIKNQDWRFREAAMQAFGSILDGPDPDTLQPIIAKAMPVIIEALKDSNMAVKDTAAWTVGRACDVSSDATLSPNTLQPLLEALVDCLSSDTRVATKACWSFRSIAESAYEAASVLLDHRITPTPDTYVLSPFFQPIVEKLLEASNKITVMVSTGKPNKEEKEQLEYLRVAAYKALQQFVINSPKDCYSSVQQVILCMLKRLGENLVSIEHAANSEGSTEDLKEMNKFLTQLCSMLQRMFKKVNASDASSIADDTMEAILKMLQMATNENNKVSKISSSTLHEDALELLSTLITLLGDKFEKYTQAFIPFLNKGLQSGATDASVCLASVVAVGDLAKALGKGFIEHSNSIVSMLLDNIKNEKVNKNIKPQIFSVFGKIANAIGHHFTNFFSTVVTSINEATKMTECPTARQMRYIKEKQIKIPPGVKIGPSEQEDEDALDYRNELRVGCLEAFAGIIEGFKVGHESTLSISTVMGSSDLSLLSPYLSNICKFLSTIGEDKKRSMPCVSAAAKLIGILCSNYGNEVFKSLYTDEVLSILAAGKRAKNYKVREVSTVAYQALKNITQSENSKCFNSKINNNQALFSVNQPISME